ncbi:MAG TPA: LssY C-terminal domain-containing protein [Bryobacteraceae bacterium]|nr:LssY C-terminal domain-containing protein [Bryobacteraceae bacterium]
MKRLTIALLASPLFAAVVPAGTEIGIRLTDKIASETTKAGAAVHAIVGAPVAVNGAMVVPAGAQLTGTVKQVRPAHEKDLAQVDLAFTEIAAGSYKTTVSAMVSGIDNARETVDDKGVITGIDGSQTFSSRIDQGIAKLEANDKLAGLAGLIQGAKQVLKVEDANPNVDYDAGAELTLKLTQPLDWRGPTAGPEAKLQPFPNQAALTDLVNRQPFRTVAEQPPRPSDMTNIMFIGTEADLKAAFEKAGWSSAAKLSAESKLETARALIESRGYKEGPMSVLLLDGQPPAMAYQKGNNTFAQRHHLRIFRRPETFDGKPVWVCSSTHDIGIDFSERDRTFIHKVDSQIDRERAKVVSDLLLTGMVRSLALVDRPGVPTSISNATGDTLETDGRMAVVGF